MMLSDDDIELIEVYHRGKLTGKALLSFEARRLSDPQFDEEVDTYRNIMEGITSLGENEFKEKITSWENGLKSQKTKKSSWLPVPALAVAATVIIFIISYGIWNRGFDRNPSSAELFEANFRPYEDLISERSIDDSGDKELAEAMAYYNAANYGHAINTFEHFLQLKPNHEGAIFYEGISLLAVGQTQEAEKKFLSVKSNEESSLIEVADWYLLLIYLKDNRKEALKSQLQLIIGNPKHSFLKEAKLISDSLELANK